MKELLLAGIFNSLKWYIGTGVFNRIIELVMQMMDVDKTGTEKREYVVSAMKSEYALISGAGVRAVIEIFLLTKKPEVVTPVASTTNTY